MKHFNHKENRKNANKYGKIRTRTTHPSVVLENMVLILNLAVILVTGFA